MEDGPEVGADEKRQLERGKSRMTLSFLVCVIQKKIMVATKIENM